MAETTNNLPSSNPEKNQQAIANIQDTLEKIASNKPEDVEEIKKDFNDKKTNIIHETQTDLTIADVTRSIESSGLDQNDQETAIKAIESNQFNFLEKIGSGGGILGIILSLLLGFDKNKDAESSEDTPDYMDSYSDTGTLITEKTKLEFTKKAKIEAEKLEAKYGIPWEVSLSQCILESGWGQSKLAREHGNYFGIKGKGVAMTTKEDRMGILHDEMHEFRTFSSMEESFEKYAIFLIKNPKGRYDQAFKYGSEEIFGRNPNYQGRDPVKFITEIHKAGYATDSNYVGKIVSVLNSVKKSDV